MNNTSLHQDKLVTNSSINTVDIRRISKILLHRRFAILGVACMVMSATTLLAFMIKPTYQSSMQILVTSNLYEGTQTNSESSHSNPHVIDYTGQLQIMLSYKLIQKAVDLLQPYYPNITIEDIKGKKNQEDKAHLKITELENYQQKKYSNKQLFEVKFTGGNPVKTQRVLQALQKVYQSYNIEQQKERLNKGLSFVNARMPEVKAQVTQAEKKLEHFRKKHNLLNPDIQSKILLESLADIQKQLQITRAQLQDANARYNNLQQKIEASVQKAEISSRLNKSSNYQFLWNEIQKTDLALAKERLRYTEQAPTIAALKQQRQHQQTLLREEIERSLNNKPTTISPQQQLAIADPKLVQELMQLQTTFLGLIATEKSLADSEQKLRSQINNHSKLIAEYNRLVPEAESKRKTLDQLLQAQQYLGLKIAQEGFDWQVLEKPNLGVTISSNRALIFLGGIAIGPTLGIATALIWELFSRTIYTAQELQKLTNLRLLGTVPKLIPKVPKKRPFKQSENGTSDPVHSLEEISTGLPCHENFDMLYQNLQILKYSLPFKSLMLTSALTGEGKTTLVLGLAASAVRMYRRVLVIDANLRQPNLHKVLKLSNDWGLSLLLVDETNTHVQDYIQPIHPLIDILTAGPMVEDTVKLLSSQRMKQLIELFEENYDLVLIDSSSILTTVDARIVASLSQAIALVGRIGRITQPELTQATEILSKLNLIGIVANDVSNYSQNYSTGIVKKE